MTDAAQPCAWRQGLPFGLALAGLPLAVRRSLRFAQGPAVLRGTY